MEEQCQEIGLITAADDLEKAGHTLLGRADYSEFTLRDVQL